MVAKTLLGEPCCSAAAPRRVVRAARYLPASRHTASFGRFDGHEVECPYHGWRFEGSGRCTAIPSLVTSRKFESAASSVRAYPVLERKETSGFISARCRARRRRSRCSPISATRALDHRGEPVLPLRHRPRGDRPDGPGAWALRPWRLVVALGHIDPRQGESVRRPTPFGFAMLRHRAVERIPTPIGCSAASRRPRSPFSCPGCASSMSASGATSWSISPR